MTSIFFFGGAQATQDDMIAWRNSALKQNPTLQVFTYPWPAGANVYHPLNTWPPSHSLLIAKTVADAKGPIFLVGHSSGAAYSNDVADKLRLHYPHVEFNLVDLDGFAPNAYLVALPSTQIWSAESGAHKSLNYSELAKFSKNFKVFYPEKSLSGTWPLHFSLVNKNVTEHTTIQSGYLNCISNLTFLEQPNIVGNNDPVGKPVFGNGGLRLAPNA